MNNFIKDCLTVCLSVCLNHLSWELHFKCKDTCLSSHLGQEQSTYVLVVPLKLVQGNLKVMSKLLKPRSTFSGECRSDQKHSNTQLTRPINFTKTQVRYTCMVVEQSDPCVSIS